MKIDRTGKPARPRGRLPPPPRHRHHRATATTAPPPSCGRDRQGFHWRNRRVARIYRTRVMTPPSPAPHAHAHAPSTEAADTDATAAAAATAGTKATAAARVSTMVPNYVLPEWCGGWNKDLRFTGFVIRPTSPWLKRGCGRLPKKRLPIIPKRSFTSIIRSARSRPDRRRFYSRWPPRTAPKPLLSARRFYAV